MEKEWVEAMEKREKKIKIGVILDPVLAVFFYSNTLVTDWGLEIVGFGF